MNFAMMLHLRQTKKFLLPEMVYVSQKCQYVEPGSMYTKMKKVKKGGAAAQKIVIPVETDVQKLVSYVCGSNILKEGGEDIKIKPDSEYPEWLWKIRTGPPPKVEDLDPNTKAYWRKLRKQGLNRNNLQATFRRF